MTTFLEDTLTRTLRNAADAAPGPGPGFVDDVRHRRSRIRVRRRAKAGAVTAVVVLAGVVLTPRFLLHGPEYVATMPAWSGTAPPPPTDRVPRFADAVPADRVWPRAVRTLPARLPDGRPYSLVRIVDDGRYLVVAGGELLLWQPGAGAPRSLGHPEPPSLSYVVGTAVSGIPAIGAGYVAWVVVPSYPDNAFGGGGTNYAEIWVAHLDPYEPGGRLAIVDNARVEGTLQVNLGRVWWAQAPADQWSEGPPRLVSVPADGGEVEPVPGGQGYVMTGTAPWARRMDAPRDMWNLNDGKHRAVKAASGDDISAFGCSPSWCIGRASSDWHVYAQRPDGSDVVHAAFTGDFSFTDNPDVAVGISPATGLPDEVKQLVWHVPSGRLGWYPHPDDDPDTPEAPGLPYWLGQHGELVVLDPSAIR